MFDVSVPAVLKPQSTVMNSILQSDASLPSASCPTDNCTWPVTPTLAVCSECMDTNATASYSSNSTCNITTYSLPLAFDRVEQLGSNVTVVLCDEYYESGWKFRVETPNPNGSNLSFDYTNSTIANFYSFGVNSTPPSMPPFLFSAYKCSFFFCIKGYSATVRLGKTTQQAIPMIASQSHLEWRNYSGHPDFWWVFDNVPEDLNVEAINEWMVPNYIRLTFGEALEGALSGEFTDKADFEWGTNQFIGDILGEASVSLANLTTMVQSISDGLTSYIRTSGPALPPDPRYAPIVGTSVPVIVVRWGWLVYAIVLQAGGLIFLGSTIYLTRRRRVLPWKGHRVPLLLANLDESLQVHAQGGLAYRQGLDDRVGESRVRLEFDGDNGLAFRRACGSRQQTLHAEP